MLLWNRRHRYFSKFSCFLNFCYNFWKIIACISLQFFSQLFSSNLLLFSSNFLLFSSNFLLLIDATIFLSKKKMSFKKTRLSHMQRLSHFAFLVWFVIWFVWSRLTWSLSFDDVIDIGLIVVVVIVVIGRPRIVVVIVIVVVVSGQFFQIVLNVIVVIVIVIVVVVVVLCGNGVDNNGLLVNGVLYGGGRLLGIFIKVTVSCDVAAIGGGFSFGDCFLDFQFVLGTNLGPYRLDGWGFDRLDWGYWDIFVFIVIVVVIVVVICNINSGFKSWNYLKIMHDFFINMLIEKVGLYRTSVGACAMKSTYVLVE